MLVIVIDRCNCDAGLWFTLSCHQGPALAAWSLGQRFDCECKYKHKYKHEYKHEYDARVPGRGECGGTGETRGEHEGTEVNTPTHALINWSVAKALPVESFPTSAVLLGSIAPDIPLCFLSLGGTLWFRWVAGWEWPRIGRHMYGTLFYQDPGWISLHNTLHSPLVLVVAIGVLYLTRGSHNLLDSWWLWFYASCLLHTLVDIPVHHDDGPLVFWPLNWKYRFMSPISYWDPRHFGRETMIFEAILFLTLALRLVWSWLRPAGS